jgi:hypothetical protein
VRSEGVKVVDGPRDFFEVFDLLCDAFQENKARHTLYLRAGVRVTHGFLFEAVAAVSRGELSLFHPQQAFPDFGPLWVPPTSLPELLTEPFIPYALLIETPMLRKFAAQSRPFSCLCLWDLLIRAFGEARVSACMTPVITVEGALLEGNPVASYALFLSQISPKLAQELPDLGKEWQRLESTLVTRVIEAHHSLFARYSSTVIPRLLGQRTVLEREARNARISHQAEVKKAFSAVRADRALAAPSKSPAGAM